jgi:acyl-CoA thioesterase
MRTNDSVAEMLELEHVGPGQFVGKNLPGPSPVVFGGQILAQSVAAAALSVPDKQIKSLHTVFARGGSPDAPLEIDVDVLQQGRTFASLSLTTHQGARMCTRSVALLHEPEPDLIRHSDDAPRASGPDQTPSRSGGHPWWELRVVDDLDLQDPDQVGPPELYVWSRFADVPEVAHAHPALLAFASDGFLIATAMRPHKGVGQALAHVTISTNVVAQTISFHDPFRADEWHLLAHHSPYAGRGRSSGRADVFTEDGRLVASYMQENIIRDFPAGHDPSSGQR